MTNVHVKLYEGDGVTPATGYVLATPTTRRDVTDGPDRRECLVPDCLPRWLAAHPISPGQAAPP